MATICSTNDGRGRSHVFVVRFDKKFDFGLSFGGSYAWQDVKDVSPATSSTPGSLYGTAAKSDSELPAYGTSSDEIKWAYKYNVGFDHAFFGDFKTTIQLFGETRAGRHYSFTMLDTAPTGVTCVRACAFGTLGTQRVLLYVPTSTTDAIVSYDSDATATGLDGLINNSALKDTAVAFRRRTLLVTVPSRVSIFTWSKRFRRSSATRACRSSPISRTFPIC